MVIFVSGHHWHALIALNRATPLTLSCVFHFQSHCDRPGMLLCLLSLFLWNLFGLIVCILYTYVCKRVCMYMHLCVSLLLCVSVCLCPWPPWNTLCDEWPSEQPLTEHCLNFLKSQNSQSAKSLLWDCQPVRQTNNRILEIYGENYGSSWRLIQYLLS